MSVSTPIAWNDPSTAVASLSPLIANNGVNNVLVKCDPASPHYGQGPRYRQARFALDGSGNAWWIDAASGLPLHNCVVGFALGE